MSFVHHHEYVRLCSEEFSPCIITGEKFEGGCVKLKSFNYNLISTEWTARGGHLGEVIMGIPDAAPTKDVEAVKLDI